MTTPRRARPAPRQSPATVRAEGWLITGTRKELAIDYPDWQPVHTQIVEIVQGLMPDGSVEYRALTPRGQAPETMITVVMDCAAHMAPSVFRCICGANSPTRLCPDFPDCLLGGES